MWAQAHRLQLGLGNAGGAVSTRVALAGGELAQLARVERGTHAEPVLRIAAHKETKEKKTQKKREEIIRTQMKCTLAASLIQFSEACAENTEKRQGEGGGVYRGRQKERGRQGRIQKRPQCATSWSCLAINGRD